MKIFGDFKKYLDDLLSQLNDDYLKTIDKELSIKLNNDKEKLIKELNDFKPESELITNHLQDLIKQTRNLKASQTPLATEFLKYEIPYTNFFKTIIRNDYKVLFKRKNPNAYNFTPLISSSEFINSFNRLINSEQFDKIRHNWLTIDKPGTDINFKQSVINTKEYLFYSNKINWGRLELFGEKIKIEESNHCLPDIVLQLHRTLGCNYADNLNITITANNEFNRLRDEYRENAWREGAIKIKSLDKKLVMASVYISLKEEGLIDDEKEVRSYCKHKKITYQEPIIKIDKSYEKAYNQLEKIIEQNKLLIIKE